MKFVNTLNGAGNRKVWEEGDSPKFKNIFAPSIACGEITESLDVEKIKLISDIKNTKNCILSEIFQDGEEVRIMKVFEPSVHDKVGAIHKYLAWKTVDSEVRWLIIPQVYLP